MNNEKSMWVRGCVLRTMLVTAVLSGDVFD